MTPLFKLPVTGGVLVGFKSTLDAQHFIAEKFNINVNYVEIKLIYDGVFKSHKEIGRLSDVTEEMAKELGFESTYKDRAKDYLQVAIWDRIHHEGKTRAVEDDLSDVLLIMVKDE